MIRTTLTAAALAQAAKPNDAQIAHIAYTAHAGTIDFYCRHHPGMSGRLSVAG